MTLAAAPIDVRTAEQVAVEVYGVTGTATALPGELDRNFRLSTPDGRSFVLKLHHPAADRSAIDLQDAAMRHVAARLAGGATPRPIDTADGAPSAIVTVAGQPRAVRLLTWLEGTPWAEVPSTPARVEQLGRLVGRIDRLLADFEHEAMRRPLLWNVLEAQRVAAFAELVDGSCRSIVEEVFDRHERHVARLGALPHQVIHNDANDFNVLVDENGQVTGLIDFGDVAWSVRVWGLAVAGAYAMQGHTDPLRAVVPLVRGYHDVAPLSAAELEVLYDLMLTRLAMSVCMAASQHTRDPGNEYLLVSQAGVGQLLERLAGESPELAHYRLRDACGYEASPDSRGVRQYFESGEVRPASVLDADVATATAVTLDWSQVSFDPGDRSEIDAVAREIDAAVQAADAAFAIGRYAEDRRVYQAPEFVDADGQPRTLHLGVDLFLAAGAVVRAPLDGTVHARGVRPRPLDSGGVLVLEHRTDTGCAFWTLFCHLDPASIERWSHGDAVHAGDALGALGSPEVNGSWPPHLHLQLVTGPVGRGTDIPGVGRRDDADIWRSICPDPNLILGRGWGVATRAPRNTGSILASRRTNMSTALSTAYREPLHIVRGEGAHLYDAEGRAWLDLVNNVCHVGHCHPRVVAAAQAQLARLNTNTRYLHEAVAEYARRLAATLPDPLNVCFFVNSGSEANDLALRLATTHTGREDVLVLDHAYHGNLSSLIDLSPYKFDRPGGRGSPETTHVGPLPDPYRGSLSGPDLGAAYADALGEQIAALAAGDRAPAAFFAESLQSCGGQIVYPSGYLARAFGHVRAAGGVCVADEVQVGLGRVGSHFWGFELQGVVPDIVALGKPIGNGHPLAAVVTTPEIAQSFVTGMEYFNTFGGNPVSAEVGLAVLDVMADERLQARARALGDDLLSGLREIAGRRALVGDVRGHGLFIGVELSRDRVSRDPATEAAAQVKEALKARGILISTDGPDDNVLKIKPPLAIDGADCARFLEALDDALAELRPG